MKNINSYKDGSVECHREHADGVEVKEEKEKKVGNDRFTEP